MKSGFVSLVGRPNAGKSTLLNRLVGAKVAIVSDKPQTTRNRILAVQNYPDGQIVFLDTPGIHRPLHRMNVRMVDLAMQAMRDVDLVALLVDASEPAGGGDRYLLELLKDVHLPVMLVLNKIDLISKPKLLPLIDRYRGEHAFVDIVPVSAMTGEGVDDLQNTMLSHLPEGAPLYPPDYLTDQPERMYAAEIVREKLLQHTRDELPFTTAVVVDQFDEPASAEAAAGKPAETLTKGKGLIRIYCSILVESDSQKPIVIGRQGDMIKRIGTEARQELERFFDAKVFLDLHVKVRERWREDERVLDQLVPRTK